MGDAGWNILEKEKEANSESEKLAVFLKIKLNLNFKYFKVEYGLTFFFNLWL